MKHSLILPLLILSLALFAQAPQGINYQAVTRNSAGAIIANQQISVRLSVHNTSQNGTIEYQETNTATTNQFGLFTVIIGQGTPSIGTLAAVTWGAGSKYLQVEFDPAGGSAYNDMGTTQLMSVPYALYAGNAANGATGATGNTGPTGS